MRIIALDRRSTGGRRAVASEAGGARLMAPFETITIDATVAACDGDGGGALGHPKVYLNLAPSGRVECPYCSRRFVNPIMLAGGAADAGSPAGDRPAPSV
jgi:uncharacterized Zn-finger protein